MLGYTLLASLVTLLAAFPASTNYTLNSYSVGAGSTNSSASTNYKLQGSTGQLSNTSASSNYKTKSGAIQAEQANVPPAPTLSNGGGSYTNQLKVTINTGSNPSDATFSIAVSTTSNFASTSYVQADGTLGGTAVYQTYTAWGGATGTMNTGLSSATTYYYKVNASQGKFTQSAYGPSANSTTAAGGSGPTLSFSVTPNTMNMGSLLAGSIITSPSHVSFTLDTNATNGGTIYMNGTNTGLVSASSSNYNITVTPPSGNLSSLSEGFGLRGLTASSPLTIQSPYNGAANVVGAVYTTFQPVFAATSAVTTGTATADLMAKSSSTTPSATDYTDTLTFVAAASF